METKKEYIAPELTVVSFKPEKGYAGSLNLINLSLFAILSGDTYQMEDYETGNGWAENTDEFWR